MSKRSALIGWCFYDWAISSFSTVISTFIFSVYFAKNVVGDAVLGTTLWGNTLGAAGFVIAVLSPLLGAAADQTGAHKNWLAVLLALTVIPVALLWFVTPHHHMIWFALAMIFVASIAFELNSVFYNAMLPHVVDHDKMGRASGCGWGLGYVGGLLCVSLCLFLFVKPEPSLFGLDKTMAEHIRITAPFVALWMTVFALPLFLFTKGQGRSDISFVRALRLGARQLWQTILQARDNMNFVKFLIASALYRDGLTTLFAFGGLYAAGTFGMDFEHIIYFAIALNVASAIGAIAFGFLDDKIGSYKVIVISLIALIIIATGLLFIRTQFWFWILAMCLGIFFGPLQAASRTFVARLAPREASSEMFGLYALTGKATAFLGPFCLAAATQYFVSQRAGMATIIIFLLIGLGLLATVKSQTRPA